MVILFGWAGSKRNWVVEFLDSCLGLSVIARTGERSTINKTNLQLEKLESLLVTPKMGYSTVAEASLPPNAVGSY